MASSSGQFDLAEYIFHHIADTKSWHIPFLPDINFPGFMSLHALMMFMSAGILLMICSLANKGDQIPKGGLANFLEAFVLFIRNDIAIANLGEKDGKEMTPFFCTMFFFILIMNLLGLVPPFATATANILVAGGMAVIFLWMTTGWIIMKKGLKGFIKNFVPSGVAFPILLILVPIEVLGVFIKTFTLMMRLFANMVAGHIVLICLMGIVVILGKMAAPIIGIAVGIYMLEILVALIQAYVFTLLSATFMGQALHSDH